MEIKFKAHFDEWSVDSDNGLTDKHGDRVPLSPKELALFCLLLRNTGNLVTKDQIIKVVWNGSAVSDSCVMRCISSLKKRLSEQSPNLTAKIKTVYGRGYRFEGEVRGSHAIVTDEAFYAVINASPDFIALKDGAGRWLALNEAGQGMYNLKGQSWQGMTDREIGEMLPEYADNLLACVVSDEAAWEARATMSFVERITLPDGEMVFYVSKSPIFNDDGSRRELVVFGRDVTELLKMQQQMNGAEFGTKI